MTTASSDWESVSPAPAAPTTGDWESVSPSDQFDHTTAQGNTITPENYGKIAAIRIQKARQSAQENGGDLNQNEQAAIMDTYRRAAGLAPLSNADTFKESQENIAKHQGELLNLARSTSSAFERQAVNFVAPAVDLISPDWGKHTRENIAAMNPFDPERVSGKAGGAVASLPLLLAGGSISSAAGIFGLQSMTESLANSEDTTGKTNWLAAAGHGAITAGSVLLGGKLAEWTTKSLSSKIPQLAEYFKTVGEAGGKATATQLLTQEALKAGINLPPTMIAMLSGTVGDNLISGQPWDKNLGETALNVAAMTIGNHVVNAANAMAARGGTPTPETPTSPIPPTEDVPTLPEGVVRPPTSPSIGGTEGAGGAGGAGAEPPPAKPSAVWNQDAADEFGLPFRVDGEIPFDQAYVRKTAAKIGGKGQYEVVLRQGGQEVENIPLGWGSKARQQAYSMAGRLSTRATKAAPPPTETVPPEQPPTATVPPAEEPPRTPGEVPQGGDLGQPKPPPLEGEVVEPEHGIIPPRPPSEPPPPMGGELPPSGEPEDRAGKALTGATLDAYTGDSRSAWDKLGDAVHSMLDGINRYSGKMFPTMTRLARTVGEKAGTYASAKIWAVEKSAELARTIIGDDADLDLKVGTLLSEDQLRSLKAKALKLPDVNVPGGKFTRENLQEAKPSQAEIEQALRINTFIGKEGSPFRTEEEYQAALADPKIQEALAKVKQHYGPLIDDLFRKALNLDPDSELAQRGFQTGIRTNLMARDPNDPDKTGMIVTGSKTGNLRNPQRGRTPFSKQATGTGEAYEGRFSEIIKNSIGRTADTSFKNDFIKSLVDQGLAKVGARGQLVSIGKHSTKAFPNTATKDLYVRSDVAGEVRSVFDPDSKEYNGMLKGSADVVNKTALVSLSEAAYHIGNQAATLVRSPGTGLVIPRLLNKTWGLLTHDPEIMRQAADLAKIGAWRLNTPETPEMAGKIYKYTLGLMSRVVGTTDQAGRLVLDDAFKKFADKGIGLNTETNRRDFVNQMGQYNRRAQSRLIAFVRDTGIGPFATAGTNFYAQGIRSLALSPGLKATSGMNAAKLRVMVAGRFAAILGSVALVNYMKWGRVDGGDNVPIGAIRLEDGKDGKIRYFDVSSLLNITRGLRAIGARALIEGPRHGETASETASDAAKDVITSALSPFEGPIVRAAAIAATGKDTSGYQVGPKVASDENAPLAHLKAAAQAANPVIARLTGVSQSPIAGKFEVQSKENKSVAMQIASRAAARVPAGQQTRKEMDQSVAERGYRQAWTAGDHTPLIEALQRGDFNKQRADELIKEAGMSDLSRTVSHLPIETGLRVYDSATPGEKTDLRNVMLQHIISLVKSSPLKAKGMIEEYKKRGIIQ